MGIQMTVETLKLMSLRPSIYKGVSFTEGLCKPHPFKLLVMVTIGSSANLQHRDHKIISCIDKAVTGKHISGYTRWNSYTSSIHFI